MTTVQHGKLHAWSSLAGLDRPERERSMNDYLTSVLALSTESRIVALREMIEAEYQLPPAELREFTASRLRVWAALAGTDRLGASALARGYDEVFAVLGAEQAMRRMQIEQSVLRSDLDADALAALAQIGSSFARYAPRAGPAGATPPAPTPSAGQQRWKFWARKGGR